MSSPPIQELDGDIVAVVAASVFYRIPHNVMNDLDRAGKICIELIIG
jgi:hypothetical protein